MSKKSDKQREEFAIQIMAAIVNASRNQGTIANADMIAKQAIQYAEALVANLNVQND